MEDCTIYVVTGSTGEYSDRSEWLTKVFADEESAKNYVLFLTRERQKLPEWDWKINESNEEAMRKIDPGYSEDYTGTSWYVQAVALSHSPFSIPADEVLL